MTTTPTADRRSPGGQPGNQNASKDKRAEAVTIRLYQSEQDLIKDIADDLGITQTEVHRRAIRELARALGLIK